MQANDLIKLLTKIACVLAFSLNANAITPTESESEEILTDVLDGEITQEAMFNSESSQTAKNILLIVDRSSSQNDKYYFADEQSASTPLFTSKFLLEKELVSLINNELPEGVLSGLRTFGYGPCLNWQQTEQLQSMQSHSQSTFELAAQKLTCAGGGTPAHLALNAAEKDLRVTDDDNKAILFLSDGNFTAETATQAVRQLKQEYGEKLCVYPIWNGNSDEVDGYQNMKKITASSCCGFTEKADNLLADGGVEGYLQRVLYDFYTPVDSDCDGLADDQDVCPHTPLTAKVDTVGCWWIAPIYFDTDKSEIISEHYAVLNELAGVLRNNPDLSVLVKGHTDTVASHDYNMVLSAKRARSVQQYLINSGLTAEQIRTEAEGYLVPVKSNETTEGRQANRRVEFYIEKS